MHGRVFKRESKVPGKPGSWVAVVSLGKDPSTGKYRQQWVTVRTRKEADTRLAEMLHQAETGTTMRPGKTTLAEFLERWLKDYAGNLSPRTAEGYSMICRRHLIPALGSMILTQVKPEHLQRYYADKLAGERLDGRGGKISPRTIRGHHMALHVAFNTAMKWGLLARNPADAVDPPRAQRVEMHIMDEDGIKAFLDAAQATPYHALFYTMLFTGLRRSEVLALRWEDVDLVFGQVSVSRSLHHLRDGSTVYRPPKTAKGRRTVALPPSAALVVTQHRLAMKQQAAALGKSLTDNDMVFCHHDGTPLLPDSISRLWLKIARSVGLNGIRLHDARHTHASLMLKQKVHPKIVQERLGHATISTTLDLYSHVAPGLQEAAALGFDEGLRVVHPARGSTVVQQ